MQSLYGKEADMDLELVLDRTDSRAEPVREWIASLPGVDKRVIGSDIATVQCGWPLGMPVVRQLTALAGRMKTGRAARERAARALGMRITIELAAVR
jgi:hypothetical protein